MAIYDTKPNDFVGRAITATEKTKTESEKSFERINEKISELKKVLQLVFLEKQEPTEDRNELMSSSLIHKLQEIEYRITELIDGIRI